MLCANACQIRTGKWLSTVRAVTVVYFHYNPCTHMDVIYRAHACTLNVTLTLTSNTARLL